MNIAIRVDASLQIGSGHLMRCLTLADALHDQGASVTFLCRHLPDSLAERVAIKGHQVRFLPELPFVDEGATAHSRWLGVTRAADARACCEALQGRDWAWLIVDHYALDAAWETTLRKHCQRILVIDDLADRPHDCDALLDQNLYQGMSERYHGLLPAACQTLLGPSYALLRSEFAEWRQHSRPRHGVVQRLLVFFGGMDADNATGSALAAIARLERPALAVDVVIGNQHPQRDAILANCQQHGWQCHVQTDRMALLMSQADLAIGAGGSATWERCALGLPALALCLADNQRQLVDDGACAGILHGPDIDPYDSEALYRHLAALLEAPHWRTQLSQRGWQCVDARGVQRVVGVLLQPQLAIRPAQAADSESLYLWRNHPEVRSVSRNSDPISRAVHERWLSATLVNPQRCLLIGERDGRAVGVLRYDLSGERAEVSIYLTPDCAKGAGLGKALLRAGEYWLRQHYPEIVWLDAEALAGNQPSQKLFLGDAYQLAAQTFEKRISN
ncbi:UDP-2,4-diacetamido-2,4,6-trideoxy-beta-L-altropyranose hydrolase [Vogesella indigofera]|uniref:UDP-2,4-diacetamido-2,4, 6-trideoxy-beta-L-altropyranose hydrolase n=1 Tax=Vogesella indigofera TaxID=45465 RepID=UPI0035B3156D